MAALQVRIYISKDAVKRSVGDKNKGQYVPTKEERSYWGALDKVQSTWMDVEMDCVFEDQFNTEHLRVMAAVLDDIEFVNGTYDDFKQLVIERYKKDWPDSTLLFTKLDKVIARGKEVRPPGRLTPLVITDDKSTNN